MNINKFRHFRPFGQKNGKILEYYSGIRLTCENAENTMKTVL